MSFTTKQIEAQNTVIANDTTSAPMKRKLTIAKKLIANLSKQDQQELAVQAFKANPANAKKVTTIKPTLKIADTANADFHVCYGYEETRKSNGTFRALTIAALIEAKFLTLKGNRIEATKGKGSFVVFAHLTSKNGKASSSAASYWRKQVEAFNGALDTLSTKGLAKATAAMDTTKGAELKASVPAIHKFLEGFKKGGTIQVEDKHLIKFYPVTMK